MNCCKFLLSVCKKDGLQSIKNEHKDKISCQDPRSIEYSINIDLCCEPLEPNAPRWDYVISYQEKCLFIEFHDASTPRNIKEIKEKLDWMRKKLDECDEVTKPSFFYWIATNNIKISKSSKYKNQLDQLRRKGLTGPQKILKCE